MNTYWQDILEEAGDEPIEAVVIGEMPWGDYRAEGKPVCVKGKILTAEEATPMLDYEYDSGYGAPDCHAINVYTPTRVIYCAQYDGATWLESIMRNPTEGIMPEMPGSS
jgi:hypothetical protein